MSVYNYKGNSVYSPPGSIMQYMGTSDPDGWIICDGKERTNNSDGRYNSLYNLGIGSGGSGTSNYTPPNLANYFLLGAQNNQVGVTGGSSSVQLTSANLPAHNHSMQHGHYCARQASSGGQNGYVLNPGLLANGNIQTKIECRTHNSRFAKAGGSSSVDSFFVLLKCGFSNEQ
jgi:microcystin-dependent protein